MKTGTATSLQICRLWFFCVLAQWPVPRRFLRTVGYSNFDPSSAKKPKDHPNLHFPDGPINFVDCEDVPERGQ
jgi:hypothetical protein